MEIVKQSEGGISLCLAASLPVKVYSPERRAEFLPNNAVTAEDYRRALEEVQRMGLHPDEIPHDKSG